MFRESLLETSTASVAQRGWATLMSFGLEMTGIGILLLVPMVVTQTIPLVNYEQLITAPMAAPLSAPRPQTTEIFNADPGSVANGGLVAPHDIPTTISRGPDPVRHSVGGDDAPVCEKCVPGGLPWGDGVPGGKRGLLPDFGQTHPNVHVTGPVLEERKTLKISRIDEGMLLTRIEPVYPPLAKIARVEGTVVLAAMIGADGRIENLRVVSGPPMLMGAALDAVRQWRYRPTMLNGRPVEVETTISVRFTLRQG